MAQEQHAAKAASTTGAGGRLLSIDTLAVAHRTGYAVSPDGDSLEDGNRRARGGGEPVAVDAAKRDSSGKRTTRTTSLIREIDAMMAASQEIVAGSRRLSTEYGVTAFTQSSSDNSIAHHERDDSGGKGATFGENGVTKAASNERAGGVLSIKVTDEDLRFEGGDREPYEGERHAEAEVASCFSKKDELDEYYRGVRGHGASQAVNRGDAGGGRRPAPADLERRPPATEREATKATPAPEKTGAWHRDDDNDDDDKPELYASTSLLTASTMALTEGLPSLDSGGGSEEAASPGGGGGGGGGEAYTSRGRSARRATTREGAGAASVASDGSAAASDAEPLEGHPAASEHSLASEFRARFDKWSPQPTTSFPRSVDPLEEDRGAAKFGTGVAKVRVHRNIGPPEEHPGGSEFRARIGKISVHPALSSSDSIGSRREGLGASKFLATQVGAQPTASSADDIGPSEYHPSTSRLHNRLEKCVAAPSSVNTSPSKRDLGASQILTRDDKSSAQLAATSWGDIDPPADDLGASGLLSGGEQSNAQSVAASNDTIGPTEEDLDVSKFLTRRNKLSVHPAPACQSAIEPPGSEFGAPQIPAATKTAAARSAKQEDSEILVVSTKPATSPDDDAIGPPETDFSTPKILMRLGELSVRREKLEEAPSKDNAINPFEEDLSTPKLLMRLDKFSVASEDDAISLPEEDLSTVERRTPETDDPLEDLSTPNLMKKAERFFSNNTEETPGLMGSTPSSLPPSVVHPFEVGIGNYLSKFDQIMKKYERMERDEKNNSARGDGEERSIGKSVREETDGASLPSVPSIKRRAAGVRFHNSLKDDGLESKRDDNHMNSRKGFESKGEDNHTKRVIFRKPLHKGSHPEQSNIFNMSPRAGLKLQTSHSQDSEECFMDIIRVGSQDSDAMSTLSRTTGCTTIGSVSISTENSAVIESFVQLVVHDIVAEEVKKAGSMKEQLEDALRSKMKLKARVKKLKSAQDANIAKHASVAKDKFNREMEIHLTRKASELKSMYELAMNQAEQSKQLALNMAQRDMEKEVSLLRSQLNTVQANGVPIDNALRGALELVESNQRALRQAAESDAKKAFDMKNDIEQSFVSAVSEFEHWSDKQMKTMEAKWESLRNNRS